MAIDPSLALSGLSLLFSRKAAADSEQAAEAIQNGDANPEDLPAEMAQQERIVDRQDQVIDRLESLYQVQAKNKPTEGDKDAFTSTVLTLRAGSTAEVTVEPQQGFHLRVKKIHVDRKADHSYELNVGGDVSSVSHRAKYTSPKLVSQGDRVVATITNNSGSQSTLDFEMEAWAERP